jgi:hypothetical protein
MATLTTHAPLTGRAVWTGDDLAKSGDWIRSLDAEQIAEIDAALGVLKRRGTPLFGFERADFQLPRTEALLADISDELENGRGAVRLRGLPVARYSEDDLRQIFWGIGRHLGTAIYQNARGEIMGEVRDETKRTDKTYDLTETDARRRRELDDRQRHLEERRRQIEQTVAKRAGTALVELDREIDLRTKQAKGSEAVGYHSEISAKQDAPKWVQVDLGSAVAVDSVLLHPCHDDFAGIGDGFEQLV